jgi:hypothetical protein
MMDPMYPGAEVPPPIPGEIARLHWRPSQEQLEAYKHREIAMCTKAMRRDSTLRHEHTIFSKKTWDAALVSIQKELSPNPA